MDSNDNLSLFKHQNQILHPKKWYKTCVTLIYYNLKEMRYHEKSKLAAILDLGTVTGVSMCHTTHLGVMLVYVYMRCEIMSLHPGPA